MGVILSPMGHLTVFGDIFTRLLQKGVPIMHREALQGKDDLFLNVSSAAVEKLYYHTPSLCFLAMHPTQVSYVLCGWPLHL